MQPLQKKFAKKGSHKKFMDQFRFSGFANLPVSDLSSSISSTQDCVKRQSLWKDRSDKVRFPVEWSSRTSFSHCLQPEYLLDDNVLHYQDLSSAASGVEAGSEDLEFWGKIAAEGVR